MEQVWANDEAAGLTGIIGSQSVQQLVFNYVGFFQLSDTFLPFAKLDNQIWFSKTKQRTRTPWSARRRKI